MKLLKLSILSILLAFISCKENDTKIKNLETANNHIKQQFAPDSRVAVYSIDFEKIGNKIKVEGETDSKKAYESLLDSLANLKIDFVNNVRILPDSIVGDKPFAVGNNSVINIRSAPKHSAELGTQGLLGMSLKVLDFKNGFYRVQTPDNYISWVDGGGIQLMTSEEFSNWNQQKKVLFTANSGSVYEAKDEKSMLVSDIVFGGLLAYVSEDASFYEVKYPDGRIGFIKKDEAILYDYWLQKDLASQENIELFQRIFRFSLFMGRNFYQRIGL